MASKIDGIQISEIYPPELARPIMKVFAPLSLASKIDISCNYGIFTVDSGNLL